MAISAAVVVGDAGDAAAGRAGPKAEAVKVGSGRDPQSEMGPVVTAAARDRIVELIGTGEQQGARLAVDGRGLTVPGFEDGFFVGPTVIDQVTTEMDVYTQEIFGPGPVGRPRRRRRVGDRPDQRQPLRQRHGDLHQQR